LSCDMAFVIKDRKIEERRRKIEDRRRKIEEGR
jgi:hypothetical protein